MVFNPLDLQESFRVIESFLTNFQYIFEKLKDLQFRDIWDPKGVIDHSRNPIDISNNLKKSPIIRKNHDEPKEGEWYK